jgi:hypothetical protein
VTIHVGKLGEAPSGSTRLAAQTFAWPSSDGQTEVEEVKGSGSRHLPTSFQDGLQ